MADKLRLKNVPLKPYSPLANLPSHRYTLFMAKTGTAEQLLDLAQKLVQERGFNAFSYRDLADSIGIKTASVHYHFPNKAELGKALMARYLEGLEDYLAELDARAITDRARLESLISSYQETESRGAICLCGALASDIETLSRDIQELVSAYLKLSESWVRTTIRNGIRSGEFSPTSSGADLAATLIAGLQGALLIGRVHGKNALLERVQRSFLASLGA